MVGGGGGVAVKIFRGMGWAKLKFMKVCIPPWKKITFVGTANDIIPLSSAHSALAKIGVTLSFVIDNRIHLTLELIS